MATDAKTVVQWTVLALLALFAIVAGLYVSPWLGRASLPLAALFWVLVIIGIFYAGEGMPWIDRFDSISNLLRIYAPPLSDDEKQEIARLAEERKQLNILGGRQTRRGNVQSAERNAIFPKTVSRRPPSPGLNPAEAPRPEPPTPAVTPLIHRRAT